MELTIVTPNEQRVYTISWIEFNTPSGNFVIQAGHAPTILTLSPGKKMTFGLTSGKRESLVVLHGVGHVERNAVTVLVSGMQ